MKAHIEAGLVKATRHPRLPLTVYNYTSRCAYDGLWDEVTLKCRGLVLDDKGNVVARPFPKFFNLGEHIPEYVPWHLPYTVTEKLDGSLLIAFLYAGEVVTCTRGSFTSPQSLKGRELLGDCALVEGYTYLFEVIYPDNAIVCDYGGRESATLLAVIETATEREMPRDFATGFEWVKNLPRLPDTVPDEEEGYVLRFSNGLRIKIKGEEYNRRLRERSRLSRRSILDHNRAGTLELLLARIHPRLRPAVIAEAKQQTEDFNLWVSAAKVAYQNVASLPSRKEQAAELGRRYPGVKALAFALLDGKDIAPMVWKSIPLNREMESLNEPTS